MQLFHLIAGVLAGTIFPLAWMGWTAVLLLVVVLYRSAGDFKHLLIAVVLFLTLLLLLALVTTLVWDPKIVPVFLTLLLENGLPHYFALVLGGLSAVAAWWVARRSFVALCAVVGVALGVPVALLAINAELLDRKVSRSTGAAFERPVLAEVPTRVITDARLPGMVLVPHGPFIRGTLNPLQLRKKIVTDDGTMHPGDSHPVRVIYLDAFFIDVTPVTNAAFARFVEQSDYVTHAEREGGGYLWGPDGHYLRNDVDWRHPDAPDDTIVGKDDHPVVQVNWYDADAYCKSVGKRLPTEAEWEKAARGPDGRTFPWGNDFDGRLLNFCDRECEVAVNRDPSVSDGYATTSPVGSFPEGASPYGALDMAGNVFEWVWDWYHPDYYRTSPDANPPGPIKEQSYEYVPSRVVKGGSFVTGVKYTRADSRSNDDPIDWRSAGVGFRCATDG